MHRLSYHPEKAWFWEIQSLE